MNRFDLYLALIEAAEGITKLIHLAVKNNKRKHANNPPLMECYWRVCVGRLLKLSRSIQKWSSIQMAYTSVRRLMLPDRISQELLNFSRSVASRFNSIIS